MAESAEFVAEPKKHLINVSQKWSKEFLIDLQKIYRHLEEGKPEMQLECKCEPKCKPESICKTRNEIDQLFKQAIDDLLNWHWKYSSESEGVILDKGMLKLINTLSSIKYKLVFVTMETCFEYKQNDYITLLQSLFSKVIEISKINTDSQTDPNQLCSQIDKELSPAISTFDQYISEIKKNGQATNTKLIVEMGTTSEISRAIPKWASSVVDIMQGNEFCCRGIAILLKIENGLTGTPIHTSLEEFTDKFVILIPAEGINTNEIEKYSLRFSISKRKENETLNQERVNSEQRTRVLSNDSVRIYPTLSKRLLVLEIQKGNVLNSWQIDGLKFMETAPAKERDKVLLASPFTLEGKMKMNTLTISTIYEDAIEFEEPSKISEDNLGIPLLSEDTLSVKGITMKSGPSQFFCCNIEKILNKIKENEKWLAAYKSNSQKPLEKECLVFKMPNSERTLIAVKNIGCIQKTLDKNLQLEKLLLYEKHIKDIRTLEHDRLVLILGFFVKDNDFNLDVYILLEYMEGTSLKTIVRKKGKVDDERAIKYVSQILEGLKFLESINLFHGNLKPSNVLLDAKDNCKLSEIASSQNDNINSHLETQKSCTNVIHSFYQSPELIYNENKNTDSPLADDIWSVGAILAYIWSGKRLNNDVNSQMAIEQIRICSIRINSVDIKFILEAEETHPVIKLILSKTLCPREKRANCNQLYEYCSPSGEQLEKIKDFNLKVSSEQTTQGSELQDDVHAKQAPISASSLPSLPGLCNKEELQREEKKHEPKSV